MTTRQLREMERQATVTQTRVQRFIELQTQVNYFIETQPGPDAQFVQMVETLELIGNSLNDAEVHEVCEWYSAQHR